MTHIKLFFLLGFMLLLQGCGSIKVEAEKSEVKKGDMAQQALGLCDWIDFMKQFQTQAPPVVTPIDQKDYQGCTYNTPELGLSFRFYEEYSLGKTVSTLQNQYDGLIQTFSEGNIYTEKNSELGVSTFRYDSGTIAGLVVLGNDYLLEETLHANTLTQVQRKEALEKVYAALEKKLTSTTE